MDPDRYILLAKSQFNIPYNKKMMGAATWHHGAIAAVIRVGLISMIAGACDGVYANCVRATCIVTRARQGTVFTIIRNRRISRLTRACPKRLR